MNYYLGLDLARKSDWSVATVIDGDGNVVACDRFHEISWSLQVHRVALLYRTFHCSKAVVDSTGIGDVVIEQLEEQGLVVEPYIFTVPSRKALIEELVLAFDNCEITIPTTEKFAVYRAELESFEYSLDGSTIRYAAPPGQHDDCVMSLALAVHGWRASRSAVLGVVLLLQRRAKEIAEGVRDAWGELIHKPAPKPELVAVKREAGPSITRVTPGPEKLPPCPACKATCVVRAPVRGGLLCNQCSCSFDAAGNVTSKITPEVAGHLHRWRVIPGNQRRCDDCQLQEWIGSPPALNGMTRTQFAARESVFGRNRYGRFG